MKARPNILHIFTDQQRFDTIAALGNPLIHTPNLDALVREGTTFTRAYSPSPECVPARASMITGWYPGRTGCFSNAEDMPPEDTPTLMSGLRDLGYRTHGIGKCHFKSDFYALRGFQTRDIQEEGAEKREKDDYLSWLQKNGYGWVLEPHGIRGEMYYIPQPSALPPEVHPTHWVADRAVDFLKNHEAETQPFYLYAGIIHPHPPFAPPIPWHKIYRAPDMPLPRGLNTDTEDLPFINRFQNRYKYRDRGRDLNLIRCLRAYYYASITFLDAQVGRIMESLKKSGKWDDTLILFSSDHGEYLGDFNCFGKRGFHDVSSRIPMIVKWPQGKMADTRCDTPTSLVDLAPTFLAAAGHQAASDEYDGIDLHDLATRKKQREFVFSQFKKADEGLYMAVNKDRKYAYSAPDNAEYFFDLEKDPHEMENLASDSSRKNELTTLRQTCADWVSKNDSHEAVADGGWREYPKKKLPDNPDEGLIFQDPAWWDGTLPIER
ncbi:MAG: sulfatase [Chthoniobacterales bacterium]